ncbi:threonine/serine dehydratase [bacterium]|nr:threonine/serine dehydratase [bacterium]
MITFDDILDAYRRIVDTVHHTPVITSRALNELSGNELYFKCENFQRVGAFKIRGAYNKISSLKPDQLKRGVVAFSSGNHAQGVALASKLLNTSAKIVMPNNSPKSKLEATKAYGAQVILYDFKKENREEIGKKISEAEGRELVPPFDDELIMAGQGTIGLEIFDIIKRLDYVFMPVGGGGLLSGNSVSLKYLMSRVRIIGVETEPANDAYQSFRKGDIVAIKPPATIADGIRTTSVGTKTFEVIKAKTDDIILVSDAEVLEAMRWIFTRLKIIIEPTAAVPFAAVIKNELKLKNKRIGIILTGGNMDMDDFFDLMKTKTND